MKLYQLAFSKQKLIHWSWKFGRAQKSGCRCRFALTASCAKLKHQPLDQSVDSSDGSLSSLSYLVLWWLQLS